MLPLGVKNVKKMLKIGVTFTALLILNIKSAVYSNIKITYFKQFFKENEIH